MALFAPNREADGGGGLIALERRCPPILTSRFTRTYRRKKSATRFGEASRQDPKERLNPKTPLLSIRFTMNPSCT